jgi:hypothetical protein
MLVIMAAYDLVDHEATSTFGSQCSFQKLMPPGCLTMLVFRRHLFGRDLGSSCSRQVASATLIVVMGCQPWSTVARAGLAYYREAGRPTLREIGDVIAGRDDLAGTASKETIRRMLQGISVPAQWKPRTQFSLRCAYSQVTNPTTCTQMGTREKFTVRSSRISGTLRSTSQIQSPGTHGEAHHQMSHRSDSCSDSA